MGLCRWTGADRHGLEAVAVPAGQLSRTLSCVTLVSRSRISHMEASCVESSVTLSLPVGPMLRVC